MRHESTFFSRKRFSYQAGSQAFDGEAAEEALSKLLGFTYAGKGASKPEHWGIPGLLWVQVLVAVVVAVALLGFLRPEILRRLHKGEGYRSTFDQLLGASGRAAGEITATTGEATINGETWTARSWDGDTIAAGVPVDVMEVDGLTVVVHPRNKPLGS